MTVALLASKEIEEARDIVFGQATTLRGHGGARRDAMRGGKCFVQPIGIGRDGGMIDQAAAIERRKQPAKKRYVAAGPEREMKLGIDAACGPARIDHDKFAAAPRPRGLEPLIKHRMAPGEIEPTATTRSASSISS